MASAVPPPYPIATGTSTVAVVPPTPGSYTLRIYDSTGALLAQSAPFTVLQHIPQTYTVSAADAASLGEAVSATFHPANGVMDAVTFGEATQVQVIFAGVASDTLTLTELAANQGSLLIDEVITLGDVATANMTMHSAASDALVLAEAAVGSTTGGGGGLLNVQFSITNHGATSVVKPQIAIGHPFAPGDVPAGYKLALYDSTGVTQNTNFQQDQEGYWQQDNSLKFAALSFVSPDTFTAGQKITYTLKAISGTPNRTPNVTLAQFKTAMVANDVAWNFYGLDLGTDTYKVSTQNVLANFCNGPWNPILPTNAASAAGTNTLYFANTSNISAGLIVTGTNIPASTKVLAVTSTTCTLSNNLTGTGVANGLNITFQYPLGGWQVLRSGPACTEYLVWSYLQRTSDGAFHGWQRAKLMVRMWGVGGPIDVATRLQRPNLYGAMPSATLGVDNRTSQYSYLSYGSQTVYTWGGAADPNNFTLTPSQFNVATATITLPAGGGVNNPLWQGGPGLTFSSTGTLPGGISPTTTYYPTYISGVKPGTGLAAFALMFNRQQVPNGLLNAPVLKTWSPGLVLPAGHFYYIVQNGYIYVTNVSSGGTTATTGTGPTGNTEYQTDGTVTWWCSGVAFSTAGTGTITAQWTVGTWRNSGFAGMTNTAQRVWIAGSSGAVQMNFTPNLDFTYLTTQSRAVPCFDPSLLTQVSYMSGPIFPYKPNTPFMNAAGTAFFLADTGDGPADERIGYINASSANALYVQDDPNSMQYANSIGLLFDDYFCSADDERAAQPPVVNMGSNRSQTAPTTYPGLAPVNRTLNLISTGGLYGNPQWLDAGYGDNASGYTMNYAAFMDSSHMPIPWYVPYLRTGDYLYYDIGRSQTTAAIASINNQYTRNLQGTITNPYTGGLLYGNVTTGPGQQARSLGWLTRAVGCCWHLMPAADPLNPYINDSLNDSAAWLVNAQASCTTAQQNMGWLPVQLATGGADASEMWMHGIIFVCIAMEAWRGERPGWGAFLKNYFVKQVPQLLDSAQGGCEGAADAQWFQMTDTGASPGFQNDFYQTALAVWQATYPSENWTSATCTNHTGMMNGISSGRTKWVARTPPMPSDGYWNMQRSAMAMGGVIGISLCGSLATRIQTRASQVGPTAYVATPVQSYVTNYVKWAIIQPASHS